MSYREQEGLEAVPTLKGTPVDHSHSGLETTTSPNTWNHAPAPQYQDRPDLHTAAWQPEANMSPPAPYNNNNVANTPITPATQEPAYNPYPPVEAEKAHKKRICGLRMVTFLLLLLSILLALAVIGAGVGGAVAGRNSNKSVSNAAAAVVGSNSTTTVMVTTTSAAATKTVVSSVGAASSTVLVTATAASTITPATDCISYNGSLVRKVQTTNVNGTAMQIICSNDWPGNDLYKVLVTDFLTCIGVGIQWNANKTNANNQGAGIAYTGFGAFTDPVNCYVKSIFSGSGNGYPTKAVAIFDPSQYQPSS